MTKRKIIEAAIFIALIIGAARLLYPPKIKADYTPIDGMALIAHAGGGLPQGQYSNSLQALDLSYANGFTLFECDFSWTQSGELVLQHDWQRTYYQYFTALGFLPDSLLALMPKRRAITAESFAAKTMNDGLTQITLDDLIMWMRAHPDAMIVTDVKSDNIAALALIKKIAPDLQARFIPQIYAANEYEPIAALGYKNIIFTLYRAKLTSAELAKFINEHDLYALTVPLRMVDVGLAKALARSSTPLFTHTVNSASMAEQLGQIGVAGLYTDYLVPAPE